MKKIFLIDDDDDDRELFELALKEVGIRTDFVYAPNGEEALKIAQNPAFEAPDYIFLDMNMPRLNGLGFLTAIRNKNIYNGIPLFIYTTSSVGPDIDKCIEMGGKLVTKHSSFPGLCNELKLLII